MKTIHVAIIGLFSLLFSCGVKIIPVGDAAKNKDEAANTIAILSYNIHHAS